MTKLDPIVSEFATQEEADAYDKWFRAEVEAALKEEGPGIPHDEVIPLETLRLGLRADTLLNSTALGNVDGAGI